MEYSAFPTKKQLQQKVIAACEEKKLNNTAKGEIQRWITEEEFDEFFPVLSKQIEAGEWDFLMDCFYRTLTLGTGGIRGVMDIGTNRMNNHTIRRASQAYAQYLLRYKSRVAMKGVAIAYDSRLHSEEFMSIYREPLQKGLRYIRQ